MSEIKELVSNDQRGKKSKILWEAYKVASEEHELQYFKEMLQQHDEEVQRRAEEDEAKEAAKAAKVAKKKAKDAAAVEADVEMEEAEETPAKPKSASKKRKKEVDSEGEAPPKPAKTPKIKLNGPKEPAAEEAPSTKKRASKPKKPKKAEPEEAKAPATPPMTEEERREKKEKMVLYLRHKLQKGFLTRDQTPKEEEMDLMDEQFKNLEKLADLEAGIIRATKINKVLKAILKLDHIPKEHEYHFKDRSSVLLNAWAPALGISEEPKPSAAAPATNGVEHQEPAESKPGDPTPEKASEPAAEAEDGDVAMTDAPKKNAAPA
jgi:hypothetical protein